MKKLIAASFTLIMATSYFVANATTMDEARQNALDFGSAYKNSASTVVTDQNKKNTPGYTTDSPEQTKYYGGSGMSGDALSKSQTSEEGKLMTQGLPSRPQVDLSPNDDFLKTSQVIQGNPDEVVAMLTGSYGECKPLTLTQTQTEVRTCDQYVEPTCINGADLVSVIPGNNTTYSYPLLVVNLPYQPGYGGCAQYSFKSTINIKDPSFINAFTLTNIGWDDSIRVTINGTVVYANGSFVGFKGGCERSRAFWDSPNLALKQYLVAGVNTVEVLLGISGSGFASATFNLDYPTNKICNTVDNCVNIPSDCNLQSTKCLNFGDNNICNYNQKVYACSTTTTTSTASVDCGSNIYCTNDQCTKIEDDTNQDFATSIAYLSSINQAAKDGNGSAENLRIFSGSGKSCEKDTVSYNNCCKDDGWGQDYMGASCSADEKTLMELQSKKMCHYVGSYCSKKVPLLGTCLKTKKSYCCFNSKIARVIMEQGKAQLGKGWGSGESPDCSGFSTDELSRLQFDKMNLGEIAADIAGSVVIPDKSFLEGKVKKTLEGYGQTSN